MKSEDDFRRFEHEGWERVAHKYDAVWSSLTRQFIPHLLADAQVAPGMSVLDVACGPGYVSAAAREKGANPTGLDFSGKMVAIAKKMFGSIPFIEGDAQGLPFDDASFDRVLTNFGLLHLSDPAKACAEAFRVLKPGGRFGFTVWARPTENPGGKIVNDAIETHADLSVRVPEGPPDSLYAERGECRKMLEQIGFDGSSIILETRIVEWNVPTARYFFDAERNAGVRTAGVLARQTPERLDAILRVIEDGVSQYARGGQFVIPMGAYVVVASKK